MSPLIAVAVVIAALGFTNPSARSEVVASYAAGATAPNPATASGGAWTLSNAGAIDGASVISAAQVPDGTTGVNAWRMLDNTTSGSQFAFWSKALTSTQQGTAAASGWRLSANLRVEDPVASNGGSASTVLLFGDNAGKRWILFLDVDAAGNLTVQLSGMTTVTVATGASATGYHLHELVYHPATESVEYLFDGVSKVTGYTGSAGTYNGVQWGNGSSGGRGDGYWNSVTLAINEAPHNPAVTVQPQSQDAAAGASVTFAAGFGGSPTSFQWFKDTVALPGKTSATLTLVDISVADAGDYWCRAANAHGISETVTAALHVLSPGAELEISEFLADNEDGLRDADGERGDWLELHNPSTSEVNLGGWWLTDDLAVLQKWPLPGQALPPGGRLVIFASGKDRRAAGAELHTNFSLGKAAGNNLALVRPDGTIAQSFADYPEQFPDISYGHTAHQPVRVKSFALPSPGEANIDGQTDAARPPSFSTPAGVFSGTQSTEIAAQAQAAPGGTLRYSTNGARPTFDSPAYAGPLTIIASTNVRAAVVYPGERYGATQSASYVRIASSAASFTTPLPIVVLHNFGAGAVPGVPSLGPNNDGSGVIEVPMQMHVMTVLDAAAGQNSFSSPVTTTTRAGLKMRGSSSFSFARKSYALETWTEFDDQARDLPLLGLPADNDWVLYGPSATNFDAALIHNSLIYQLARESGYDAPRTRFVELFLNTGGGDLTLANNLGLYLLVEKPKRSKERVDFDPLSADGARGGWMINVDRMDALPPGSAPGSMTPRHFHTAGPDRILQTPNDNPRGYQGILTPGGSGSGGGIGPANDDMPNFYHSFFNFESPGGWDIRAAQRGVIESKMRAFDAALYGASWQSRDLGYAPHIDRRNWAHHLALHTFTKNQDAVVLSAFIYRETPASPLRWGPIWDFDRAYNKNPTSASPSANTNWAHDRLFYRRLTADLEFMQAYVDAWQDMRRGAFSDANMRAVVDSQIGQITDAVAIRSGLASGQLAANASALKSWLVARGAALDALYTAPAVFSQGGGIIPEGFSLTITAPAGTIHYTTDGTDPRAVGGGVAPNAQPYSGPIAISASTTIFARARAGSAWSGATVASYYPPQDLQTLRVTEIHYNPRGAGGVDGDEFEFLELQNTGSVALDLAGLSFSGLTYTFPAGAQLAPGGHYLLARNEAQLASRFTGVVVDGIYAGKLDNNGETLALLQGGTIVWSFEYSDRGAWPEQADDGDLSLQRPDPALIGYDPATWTAAAPTPGAALSLADSDSDGMPDYWEALYGIFDGAQDADGDGQANRAEFLSGTNPRDPASVFTLVASPKTEEETLALEFQALAGRSYTVQYCDDLTIREWQKYYDVPVGPITRTQLLTVPMDTAARRLFRVITPAIAGAALLVPASGSDSVALDSLFSDGVVLQRDAKLPVWGTAGAGHEVTVTLNGVAAAAVADRNGHWLVELPPQAASKTPRTLQVLTDGQAKLAVEDVLIGDVWLCAGQSNMEFRCNQETTWNTEQASAAQPHVRLWNMTYAGQGVFGTAYSASTASRQTPGAYYSPSAWTACNATTAATFSAVGYFFGKEMHTALDVPVGLINLSVGGSPAEAWVRRGALAASSVSGMVNGKWLDSPLLEPWCVERAKVQLGSQINTAPGDDLGPNHAFKPSFLWDAGPGRIAPFAIRGVLWYQGESNALSHLAEAGVANPKWRVEQHEQIFTTLVKDWRAQWGQGDFPFLVCQLSSISETNYASHFWPEFRDSQRRALKTLPNLGLAVTSDIGHTSNVHPANKRDVGKRLAHWARRYIHGDERALPCPLPERAMKDGSNVSISFQHAGASLATSNGTAPASFELAGADGAFRPASAVISGSNVIVSAANVPSPTAVRYGWKPYSDGNLVNAAGLPASTFLVAVP